LKEREDCIGSNSSPQLVCTKHIDDILFQENVYIKSVALCARMCVEIGSHQWFSVDQWWGAFNETKSVTCTTSTDTILNIEWIEPVPKEMELWWDSYTDIGVIQASYTDKSNDFQIEDGWTDIGTWWDAYNRTRADDIAELDQILTESDELWGQRNGPFDADPLSADVAQSAGGSHPFNLGREEEWSDWLAQLLRADSGEFHRELFGETFESSPRRVEREAHLPNPTGKDRYADILSQHGSNRISVEVKVGDRKLKKTTDTTALIENQYYGEWQHYLLLPEQDLWAVREIFDIEISTTDGERDTIPSEASEEVLILYWSDVSRALRTVLLTENAQTPHWSASAYLFCARIEQEQLGFTPQPIIDQIGTEANKVQSFRSVSVVIGNIEGQSEYLKTFTEANNE